MLRQPAGAAPNQLPADEFRFLYRGHQFPIAHNCRRGIAVALCASGNYLAGTIMPIGAGLAIVGAIINFATQRPVLRLVGVALAMLCVSGIWKLVMAMMSTS